MKNKKFTTWSIENGKRIEKEITEAIYEPGEILTMGITYKSGLVDSFVMPPENIVIFREDQIEILNPKDKSIKTHRMEAVAGIMVRFREDAWETLHGVFREWSKDAKGVDVHAPQ